MSHVEVERSFSPLPDSDLPDLRSLSGVAALEPSGEVELDATYYDVPGLPLLRAGVTLRRRTGGDDEGWHLKLPGGSPAARVELHADLEGSGAPPAAFADLVAGWTRGVALAPVARIRTHRETARLVGPDGVVLAELADDRVEGLPAQVDAEPSHWREWEVELMHGDERLLDAVDELLADQGVRRSAAQHKLARVLAVGPEVEPDEPLGKGSPAGDLLHRWIRDQVREVELLDPAIRQGEPGGVHGMRKACRRLRAALATYRRLVERDRTDPVRDELRWLARSLGDARDDEVVLERIDAMLTAEPEDSSADSARRVLERYAQSRAAEDEATLERMLDSRRYFDLRDALDELAAAPPFRGRAEHPARDVLPPLVRKEEKRVDKRRRGGDPHEFRKAVKRLRYAYELVEPAWGKSARRPRRAARELTRVLGDRQDALAAREWLVALSAEAARGGESAFAFGRLHALEELHAREALEQADPLWRDLAELAW